MDAELDKRILVGGFGAGHGDLVQHGSVGLDAEELGRGLTISSTPTGGNVLLEGFSVRNGKMQGNGGAISCANGSLALESVEVRYPLRVIRQANAGPGAARLGNGVQVSIPQGHPASGSIALALRPERLAIHRQGEAVPPGRNQMPARITRRTYFGDVYYYDVDAGLASVLDVKEENRPEVGTHDVGDQVVVSWNVEAANLVSE